MPLPNVPSNPPLIAPGNKGAAYWNSQIGQPLTFLVSKPRFRARLTVAGNPTKGSTTMVPWDTVDEDNYSGWSSGSNTRYTVQQAGWYLIVATVSLTGTGASGTVIEPYVYTNGTATFSGQEVTIPTSGPMSVSSQWFAYGNLGDYFEIGAFYSSEPAANLGWNTTAGQQPNVGICFSGCL